MAYIGNTVQNQGFAPAVDYFNGDGTTVTFTLSRPVASVAQLTAVIDNVIQNPSSAFTVAGNAITFTSAPLAGTNNIWVEYTSLVTTYAAISQDPSVIGDITASGGFLATGDFGNTYTDGTIVDYVTGNARITTGPVDGLTIYNGGPTARVALAAWDTSGNLTNTGNLLTTGSVGAGTTSPSTYSAKVASYSTTASGANISLVKGDSGTANQNGQLINFYNYGPAATGRNAGTTIGGFYFGCSQPSSGAIQDAGAISCVAETQTGNNTASALTFSTNTGNAGNVERMRINASGQVTVPSQPAFRAVKSGSPSGTSENPVQYDVVDFNIGSHYNNGTYRFTAPVAGRYFFTTQFNFYVAGDARQVEIGLKVNGTTVQGSDCFMQLTQGNNTHTSATISSVLNLAAGDYVQGAWISSTATVNFYSSTSRNAFSGYLLG